MSLEMLPGLIHDLWSWMALAVVLLILELLTGTLVLLGMAAGAVAVGLVQWMWPGTGWEILLLVFSALTVMTPLLGKHLLVERPSLLEKVQFRHIGRIVPLSEPIAGGEGALILDGCRWKCEGPDLPAGEKVLVLSLTRGRLTVVAATVAGDRAEEAQGVSRPGG